MADMQPTAPVFTSKIDVASTISLSNKEGKQDRVSLSVTLQGDKPVMVSASRFWTTNLEYVLSRPRAPPQQEEIEWMPFRNEDAGMAGVFSDDPAYEVAVDESGNFRCVRLGEPWTLMLERIPDIDEDPDLQSDDQLTISFTGANDGRPKLIIPAADKVTCHIVE